MNVKIMTSPAIDERIMSILRLNLVPVGAEGWRMEPVTSLGSSREGSSTGFSGCWLPFLNNDEKLKRDRNFMCVSLPVFTDLLDDHDFFQAVPHFRLREEAVNDVVVLLDSVIDEGYLLPVAHKKGGGLA
ncbi:MAG: hypothetical protein A4E62_02838 [Syntrophorhabdus sp. PtaU1.Bin002]|nr:MAG: hypothetical protein A4E62_02838 [Syntrophorhabdus sp. PtaU1.Bin002]